MILAFSSEITFFFLYLLTYFAVSRTRPTDRRTEKG